MLLWTSHICTVLNLLLPFMKIIYVLYFASSKNLLSSNKCGFALCRQTCFFSKNVCKLQDVNMTVLLEFVYRLCMIPPPTIFHSSLWDDKPFLRETET